MKLKNYLLSGVAILLFASCGTMVTFPTSNVVPTADITAKKQKDKNNNYNIEVTAKNLASPDRLSPAKSTYVIWFVSDNTTPKNAGQLNIKNAKTSTLKTTTPYDVNEIFITAEDQGNISYPSGTEIARVTMPDNN